MPGLRESIVTSRMLAPPDIARLYRSDRGSIYGIETRRGLTSAFKPGNRCPLFPNLYYCGGSSNPGAGVPMVLMSGQIAAECVLADQMAGPGGEATDHRRRGAPAGASGRRSGARERSEP